MIDKRIVTSIDCPFPLFTPSRATLVKRFLFPQHCSPLSTAPAHPQLQSRLDLLSESTSCPTTPAKFLLPYQLCSKAKMREIVGVFALPSDFSERVPCITPTTPKDDIADLFLLKRCISKQANV